MAIPDVKAITFPPLTNQFRQEQERKEFPFQADRKSSSDRSQDEPSASRAEERQVDVEA